MRVNDAQAEGNGDLVFGDCLWCDHEIVRRTDGNSPWTHYRGTDTKTKRKCWRETSDGLPHVAFPTAFTMERFGPGSLVFPKGVSVGNT